MAIVWKEREYILILLFLFIAAIILMVILSIAMLIFFMGVLFKNYRSRLQTILLISAVFFATLFLIDFLIYQSLMSAVNESASNGMILDIYPFPEMMVFSINWHIPFIIFMLFATLILTRKIRKRLYFWITFAISILLICGLLVLGQQICSKFTDQNLHAVVWWL